MILPTLRRAATAALLTLLLPVVGVAQKAATLPLTAPLPLDSAIRVGALPNGLRYYIRSNARPENRAAVWLAVNAGSLLESDDQRGLAHFLEHMAFNGTRNFPKHEIIEYLQRVGMRFGADVNAYTSFDETVYNLEVPTDSAGVLEKGLDIVDDFAEGVLLDPAEIDKERGVVVEEWRLGQGASTRMNRVQFPVLFHGSRYAERLPIGTREVLEGFEHEALRRYYHDWYRPDLMAVIVVGDVNPAAVERQILERFSDNRAAGSSERPSFRVPDREGTAVAIATDPEATQTNVELYFLQPPQALRTVGDLRREIVESLFAQMLNARFGELTQKPNPPFIGAGGGQGSLVRGKDVFSLGALVEQDGIVRGLEALLTEAMRVRRHGFTAGELERAKANRLRALERAYAERQTTESQAYAAEYVRHFLEGEAAPGIAAELALSRRFLPEITLDEVNRLAGDWVSEHNRVLLVSAPEGAKVPTEAELLAVFDRVAAGTVAPYVDEVQDEPLIAAPPAAGRVVASRELTEIGVTEWTLSNGVRVLLKPTDFKADEVLLAGTSPGGTSLAPDSLLTSAEYAVTAALVGGVGAFDAVTLQKRLAGKSVRVQPAIADLSEGFAGNASAQDLETMLQLVHLYATAPRADSAAFEAYRERLIAYLANQGASPEQAFSDTLRITMAQGHPRERPFDTDAARRIQLERSLSFYRDRFADLGDFTFALVGAFELDEVRPLVERWLGSLPSTGRKETWRDTGVRAPDGVVRKTVRRGVEPKSQTQLVFNGEAPHSREESHLLGTLADVLEDRLRDRLREELSGTYSPSVGGYLAAMPYPHYAVGISFGSAPERSDELLQVVMDEIATLKRDGPTAADVAKAKEAQRRDLQRAQKENGYWTGVLTRSAVAGTDPLDALRQPALIDAMTAERLRDAARRYLREDRYVLVTLQPEKAPESGR